MLGERAKDPTWDSFHFVFTARLHHVHSFALLMGARAQRENLLPMH